MACRLTLINNRKRTAGRKKYKMSVIVKEKQSNLNNFISCNMYDFIYFIVIIFFGLYYLLDEEWSNFSMENIIFERKQFHTLCQWIREHLWQTLMTRLGYSRKVKFDKNRYKKHFGSELKQLR